LPASEQVGEAPDRMVALAPDGSAFVYVGVGPNGRRLYLRRFESFQSRPLPGTEDAAGPFFSPDGRWVGFRAGGKLRKVSLAGGSPVAIADVPSRGPTWSDDGRIIYGRIDRPGLWSVSEDGGAPTPLTTLDSLAGETGQAYPHALPNGDVIVTTRNKNGTQIGVVKRGDTRVIPLFPGTMAVYASTGHIVFLERDTLRAIAYELGKRRVIGEPFTIEHTSASGGAATWEFALSQSGALLTIGTRNRDRQLVAGAGAESRTPGL
jgi:eukaryotic-like serine/threonine-protein kinase